MVFIGTALKTFISASETLKFFFSNINLRGSPQQCQISKALAQKCNLWPLLTSRILRKASKFHVVSHWSHTLDLYYKAEFCLLIRRYLCFNCFETTKHTNKKRDAIDYCPRVSVIRGFVMSHFKIIL